MPDQDLRSFDSERAKLRSKLEAVALNRIEQAGLPCPVAGYRFAPPRRWLFDFAWPERTQPVAVEIEGGTWSRGKSGHTSGAGYARNLEKYNHAATMGWVVLRFDVKMVEDGRMIETLNLVFNGGDAR